jgi:hypothetical protein
MALKGGCGEILIKISLFTFLAPQSWHFHVLGGCGEILIKISSFTFLAPQSCCFTGHGIQVTSIVALGNAIYC